MNFTPNSTKRRTYPSSTAVARLEGIDHDRATRIATHYWDRAFLERLLSTPAGWAIAQRFMPESTAGWRVWGTEVPNRWIGDYRGHIIHMADRVGSAPDFTLQSVERRADELEELNGRLPQHHELRMRAYYVDDKHGSIRGCVDYLCPRAEDPLVAGRDLHRSLGGGEVDDDHGQSYALDLRVVETFPFEDNATATTIRTTSLRHGP
jgi:hypothetical protein